MSARVQPILWYPKGPNIDVIDNKNHWHSQYEKKESATALHDVSVKWCLVQKREGGRIESRCSHLRRCKYFDCVVLFRERSSRRKVLGPSPFGVTSRIFCLDGFGISVRSYRYV